MDAQIFFTRTLQTTGKRHLPLFPFVRALSTLTFLFFLLNFGTQEAFADSEPEKKEHMEKARKAFVKARSLCEKGKYQDCIKNYKESLQFIRRAGGEPKREGLIQFNMAQAYRMLKLYREAISLYRAYLKILPDAPNREAVESVIKELEKKAKKEEKQPDPESPAKPDIEPTTKPDPEPTAKPDPEPTAKPDPEPTAKPDPEPTAKPDPEPTTKPDPEPPAKPDPVPPQPRPHDADSNLTKMPSTTEDNKTPMVTSDMEVRYTPKSRGWLWVGITSGLVALGFEAFAWTLWAKYEGGKTTSNNSYGAIYYTFHGIAGLTAALAVTGFVMYAKSGGKEKPLKETAVNTSENKEPGQNSISWNPVFSPSSNGVMLGVQGSWR